MPIGIKRSNYYSKVLSTIKFKLIKMHFLSSNHLCYPSIRCCRFYKCFGKHPMGTNQYGYKEWGNIRCFENPIVVFGSVHCNILYCIVEYSLSSVDVGVIGQTTLKSRVTCVIVLSLCSWINLICMKDFTVIIFNLLWKLQREKNK